MAWKLKKAAAADEPRPDIQGEIVGPADDLSDDLDFGASPSEASFDADPDENASGEFYSSRLSAVDDAIAAFTTTKGKPNAADAEPEPQALPADDDWSLDAFAPYKPEGDGAGGDTLNHSNGAQLAPVSFAPAETDLDDGFNTDVAALHAGPVADDDEPIALGGDWAAPAAAPEIIAPEPPKPAPKAATPPKAAPPAPPAPTPDRTLVYGEAPSAAAAAPKMLVVRLGRFAATYPLAGKEMIIGRPDPKTGAVPDVAIELDDAISRRHARVVQVDGRWCIEDLGSKNGTHLNENVLPPNRPVPVSEGDRIQLGDRTVITFESE